MGISAHIGSGKGHCKHCGRVIAKNEKFVKVQGYGHAMNAMAMCKTCLYDFVNAEFGWMDEETAIEYAKECLAQARGG